jgi:hypothetical protein
MDAAIADKYAEVKLSRERQGLSLGENDLWILATAISLAAVPVTATRRPPVRMPAGLRRRARKIRDGSLGDNIHKFLVARGGKPASVRQIAEGVVAAGYRSTAKNLELRVRTTLSGGDFAERSGRGMCRAKDR